MENDMIIVWGAIETNRDLAGVRVPLYGNLTF